MLYLVEIHSAFRCVHANGQSVGAQHTETPLEKGQHLNRNELTDRIFRSFPQSFQITNGIISDLDHRRFLPNPFHFSIPPTDWQYLVRKTISVIKYRAYTKEWCGLNNYSYWNRTILLCMPCITHNMQGYQPYVFRFYVISIFIQQVRWWSFAIVCTFHELPM
jgi:hypothetical protein